MAFVAATALTSTRGGAQVANTSGKPLRGTSAARRGATRARVAITMDAPGRGIYSESTRPQDVHVVVFGATGYIGRYVALEFVKQGYQVTAFARERSGVRGRNSAQDVRDDLRGARVVFGDVTDRAQIARAFTPPRDERRAVATVAVSCLASRTGGIADSNRIDYEATLNTLEEGIAHGVSHYILLSAICVQKPELEFQRAKLRLEAQLRARAAENEELSFSIVRPTAFFKSLAGQVERLKKGRAYVMFGDGNLCRCNAISEADLARFLALCARDESKRNATLGVGGPGAPVSPRQQADMLFRLLQRPPRYTRVPLGLMDAAIGALEAGARVLPFLRDAAEFGRIGRYYAVEDMVAPSFGDDTLEAFFQRAVADGGMAAQDLGDASVF